MLSAKAENRSDYCYRLPIVVYLVNDIGRHSKENTFFR